LTVGSWHERDAGGGHMSGRTPDRPVRLPANFQTWQHLTFLHWRYDAGDVQRLVPPGLTVQAKDGLTWVGLTPFRMARVRLPGLPPPGWDAFPELNIRTYVRDRDGRDGIWFLGLLVPRRSFVAALRPLGLPYMTSDAAITVDGPRRSYRFDRPAAFAPGSAGAGGTNADTPARFTANVHVGPALPAEERTALVETLTGRWLAYHRRGGLLWRTPVAHEPWPLYSATATGDLDAPLSWAGLPPPGEPPLVHAAGTVNARFGLPRPVPPRRWPVRTRR